MKTMKTKRMNVRLTPEHRNCISSVLTAACEQWHMEHHKPYKRSRRRMIQWLITWAGVAASEDALKAMFKPSYSMASPDLLDEVEVRAGLPAGSLSTPLAPSERLAKLDAGWPDRDPWITGENAFRAIVACEATLEAELRSLLLSARHSEMTFEQRLTLLGLVSQFTGAIHSVRPLDMVASTVIELNTLARQMALEMHSDALRDALLKAKYEAALGALSHDDCSSDGCIWTKETLTFQEAKRAELSFIEAAAHYGVAASLAKREDDALYLRSLGGIWSQHMARSRYWAKAGETKRAREVLMEARGILPSISTPVRVTTDLLVEAMIVRFESGDGSRAVLKNVDQLAKARRLLVDTCGTEDHHLVACTDVCIARAKEGTPR